MNLGFIDQFLFSHLLHTVLVKEESDKGTMFGYPCGIQGEVIFLEGHLAVSNAQVITPRVIYAGAEDVHVVIVFLNRAVGHILVTVDAVLNEPHLQLSSSKSTAVKNETGAS